MSSIPFTYTPMSDWMKTAYQAMLRQSSSSERLEALNEWSMFLAQQVAPLLGTDLEGLFFDGFTSRTLEWPDGAPIVGFESDNSALRLLINSDQSLTLSVQLMHGIAPVDTLLPIIDYFADDLDTRVPGEELPDGWSFDRLRDDSQTFTERFPNRYLLYAFLLGLRDCLG